MPETAVPMMQFLAPHLYIPYDHLFGRNSMDISIIATIGFTVAAVVGIIVLIVTAGKKKGSHN